ncbi:MAG: GtrA family protein [Mucilaginibacter sp.]|nr:GtrA family protein [Mucilaginibacter sp.]
MRKINYFLKLRIFKFIDLFYYPFRKWIPLHTFLYAACGGFNTALDITCFWIGYHFIFNKQDVSLHYITLSPHTASLFLAFSISFCSGFYLNRYIVFKESGLSKKGQLYRYILVNFCCICLNYIFLKFLVEFLHLYPTPSKFIATIFVVFFSYFSQTYFFFVPARASKVAPGGDQMLK